MSDSWLTDRGHGQTVLNERIRELVYEVAVWERRACRWPRVPVMGQVPCAALTVRGEPCRRYVSEGFVYCGAHRHLRSSDA